MDKISQEYGKAADRAPPWRIKNLLTGVLAYLGGMHIILILLGIVVWRI